MCGNRQPTTLPKELSIDVLRHGKVADERLLLEHNADALLVGVHHGGGLEARKKCVVSEN